MPKIYKIVTVLSFFYLICNFFFVFLASIFGLLINASVFFCNYNILVFSTINV